MTAPLTILSLGLAASRDYPIDQEAAGSLAVMNELYRATLAGSIKLLDGSNAFKASAEQVAQSLLDPRTVDEWLRNTLDGRDVAREAPSVVAAVAEHLPMVLVA